MTPPHCPYTGDVRRRRGSILDDTKFFLWCCNMKNSSPSYWLHVIIEGLISMNEEFADHLPFDPKHLSLNQLTNLFFWPVGKMTTNHCSVQWRISNNPSTKHKAKLVRVEICGIGCTLNLRFVIDALTNWAFGFYLLVWPIFSCLQCFLVCRCECTGGWMWCGCFHVILPISLIAIDLVPSADQL